VVLKAEQVRNGGRMGGWRTQGYCSLGHCTASMINCVTASLI
jgi:hypothetical protein